MITDLLSSAISAPSPAILNARLIGLAKVWLWAVPGMMLLAVTGAWRWRHDTRVLTLAASALVTILGFLFVPYDQGHGWGFRYFHSAWMTLPVLAAAALTPVSQTHQDTSGGNGEELRTFVVACALLSLLAANTLRAVQIGEFMTEHLAQLPRAPDIVPRIEIIDTSNSFYGADLVQNEPHLRGGVIRMISHGATADHKLLAQYYPGYRRVYVDHHGEVWSPAPDSAGAPAGPSTRR